MTFPPRFIAGRILGVLAYLEVQTQNLAQRTAADKSGHFLGVLEDSWSAGGSLPFRLLLVCSPGIGVVSFVMP